MNKYIEELSKLLNVLSNQDRQDALSFYTEYLQDGGFKTFEECFERLGTPQMLANKIIANYRNDSYNGYTRDKRNVSTVLILMLCIIAIPFVITAVSIIFSILVAIFSIVFSIFVTIAALGLAAIIIFFLSFWLLFTNFWIGLFYLGLTLATIGFVAIIFDPVKWLIVNLVVSTKKAFVWSCNQVKNIFSRITK
ncbi:hypothetical protein FD06_GL000093 [Apilactobacillus ozensis DSM 23829 = JCM 17196]|uniref:DUF1700 domain-containing protein n=1 Tax=Apilactobacillus ozensis DSM 23829 = JCM 17196 TaxID=1423781 RepID=A0A0R2ASR9_9LACO|nr:DUF1700 domain-containing protein [Apilactobacillus ozensis]KRM69927.1 hypothetical protein FD06_GL000093 [Apilactobacillus ozensis DSM 23829 = JCM 17196]